MPLFNEIDLAWSDNSVTATSYVIQRSDPSAGGFTQVGTVDAGSDPTYADTTVEPGTAYSYRILAASDSATSEPSGTASATTDPTIAIAGDSSVNLGETYTLRSSEQQSSLCSDLIDGWKIDWGDGNIDTISGDPGSFTHLYAKPGGYVIAATASTADGPLDQEQIQNVSVVRLNPFLLIEATESVQETQAVVLHR